MKKSYLPEYHIACQVPEFRRVDDVGEDVRRRMAGVRAGAAVLFGWTYYSSSTDKPALGPRALDCEALELGAKRNCSPIQGGIVEAHLLQDQN